MKQMIFVADNSEDNIPIGIMFIDTSDVKVTIQEIFDNEPDCDSIHYGVLGSPELPNGMMVNWDALNTVWREE